MSPLTLRAMQSSDRWEVAELISVSTNFWYQTHGRPAIFPGGPEASVVFFDVYEALDPGCGVVAVDTTTGRLAGSCFFHPRPTHISLGIMNVHPNHFGRGVAGQLLRHIIDRADREAKPLRLVSSAMNLDSFSLYTRAGFVPQVAFQDMFIAVPPDGLPRRIGRHAGRAGSHRHGHRRHGRGTEMDIAGISREKTFATSSPRTASGTRRLLRARAENSTAFSFPAGTPAATCSAPGAADYADAMLPLVAAETQSASRPVASRYRAGAKARGSFRNSIAGAREIAKRTSAKSAVPPRRRTACLSPTFLPESA